MRQLTAMGPQVAACHLLMDQLHMCQGPLSVLAPALIVAMSLLKKTVAAMAVLVSCNKSVLIKLFI